MGLNSKIQWTTHTFNPWRGCARVSPGCENCYAETLSHRNPKLLGVWGAPAAGGTRVIASPTAWREVLRWNADAAGAKPGEVRVFCASLADVFEDLRELDEPRSWLWELIRCTPNLTWLLLTKRIQNVTGMVPPEWVTPYLDVDGEWTDNVWLGTTVEDQKRANERVPILLGIPAPVRFLSMEPQIESIEVANVGGWRKDLAAYWWGRRIIHPKGIGWIIQGGESGYRARPFNLKWARDVRDACAAAGVPYFMKQLGVNALDGVDPLSTSGKGGYLDEIPADLRIRQIPGVDHVQRV